MEYLIIGIAVLFNIIVIKVKFEKRRYADALLDAFILVILTMVFSGGYGTLVIGTIASAGFSIYLMFNPPKLPSISIPEKEKEKFMKKLNKRLNR